MLHVADKIARTKFTKPWLSLALVFALLMLLSHISQHGIATDQGAESQCEFCLNGSGPVGLTSTGHSLSSDIPRFHWLSTATQDKPLIFFRYFYSPRAPPGV